MDLDRVAPFLAFLLMCAFVIVGMAAMLNMLCSPNSNGEYAERCEKDLKGVWRDEGRYDTEICEREGIQRTCQTWQIFYPEGCYKPAAKKVRMLEGLP